MKEQHKIRGIAFSLSTCLMLSATQASWSQQGGAGFAQFFKSFIQGQTGSQTATADSINQLEAQISTRIIDAINQNKLSFNQTQELKSQMDRIKQAELNYRSSNGLDALETASLTSELNKVNANLTTMLGGGVATPGVPVADSTEVRFKELSQRITTPLVNGKLTIDEARALKAKFDAAWNERNNYKVDGTLSADELNRINNSLDALQMGIKQNVHDTQAWPGIDNQQNLLLNRLSEALSSGKLAPREHADLKAEADRIAQMEGRARANGLQLDETLALAVDLNQLRAKIDQRLSGTAGDFGTPDGSRPVGGRQFDLRQADTMARIDRGVASGKLTAREAEDLRAAFRRLEQMESGFRTSHAVLTADEVGQLQRGLESIRNQLSAKLHDDDTAEIAPDIETKKQALVRKINNAVARRRLTSLEAALVNQQLDRINWLQQRLGRDGRLDQRDSTQIVGEINKLNDIISKELSEREMIGGGGGPGGGWNRYRGR